MCLIFIALNKHPDYPVIIAANRDEFYARPTETANFWSASEHSDILAGRDLQAGGTWLGCNRSGNFAAVTNFRETSTDSYSNSRGSVPLAFLQQGDSAEFSQLLTQDGPHYAGFNCLYGKIANTSTPELYYYSNRNSEETNKAIKLAPGIYGLSNALLNSDWFKVEQGKAEIVELLSGPLDQERWFDFLGDQQQAEDHQLPSTGVPLAREKLLSSRFIHSESYGTRCSTLITVNRQNRVNFAERSYNEQGQPSTTSQFTYSAL